MKRTLITTAALAAFALANVRGYQDAEDPTIGNDVRSGLVVIVPSHDLCYGLEVEHGEPDARGFAVHHIDTFGGDCE